MTNSRENNAVTIVLIAIYAKLKLSILAYNIIFNK